MKTFLEKKNIERKIGITLENFSFKAKILDLGDFEYERYTEHARQHLAERERVKQAKNDEGWVVETLEDVNNDLIKVSHQKICLGTYQTWKMILRTWKKVSQKS